MTQQHLINANIHRAKEGARVLEDIARFILRSEQLFAQARNIRHNIPSIAPDYAVMNDLGGLNFAEDNIRVNLASTVQANALRLQEALRVIEEFTTTQYCKAKIKTLRYQSYAAHRDIYEACKIYMRKDKLSGLYIILDPAVTPFSMKEAINIINHSSVNIVQLRDKNNTKQEILSTATQIRNELDTSKIFIMNDHIDIALDVADGVHIGQNDYPPNRVRNCLPDNFILGVSCHNSNEAKLAEQAGASYISVGCIFETNSKSDTTQTSLATLRQITSESNVPVCAIGGINDKNLQQVTATKTHFAAVISSIWQTENPLSSINMIHDELTKVL